MTLVTTAMTTPSSTRPTARATRTLPSPVGALTLHASARGLRAVLFPEPRHPLVFDVEPGPGVAAATALVEQAARELDEYFAGRRRDFTVPLDPEGTPFQRTVWTALATIPYAVTWSYGQLAGAIGKPSASRAVGAANGRNPIAIIVPCHRVIGHDGSATGYGGGLPTKRWLLAHEAAVDGRTLPGL